MRIDIILAERSRVRADLVVLRKAIKAVQAQRDSDTDNADNNDVLVRCLADYQRLTERLTFIDETVTQAQCRKTG